MKTLRLFLFLYLLTPAFGIQAQSNCIASFTQSTNGATVTVNNTSLGNYTQAYWNFGDNSNWYAATSNPFNHVYSNVGTYWITLGLGDSLCAYCCDSIGHSTNITSVCSADFTTVDSVGYIFFINTSTLGNSGVYYWDFGDNNSSTQQYPSNAYSTIGTYQVCLIAYDPLQGFCDSTCHNITVTNVSGITENSNSFSSLNIAPNPCDENVNISFTMTQEGNVQISVFDIVGRVVSDFGKEHYASGKQIKQIDTQGILPGTYFVQINLGGQIQNCKMIVTHKQ